MISDDFFVASICELLTRDDTEFNHARVLHTVMSESMKTDTVNIVQRGFELFKSIEDIAEYISKQLNSKYCASNWNCIICKCCLLADMSYSIKDMKGRFIFLRFLDYELLIWGIQN